MKKYRLCRALLPILLCTACVTAGGGKGAVVEAPPPESGLTLDAAIREIGAYFTRRLEPGSAVALLNIDTEKRTLSDYIFEELWVYFEDHSSLLLVDRQKLELIDRELAYQLSGQVSDDSAKSIGRQFGPQTLVYGKLSRLGADNRADNRAEYRLSVYATDVERATSSVRAFTIRADSRLSALLASPEGGKAGIDMAKVLYAGTGNPFRFTVQTGEAKGDYHEGDYMTLRLYSEKDAWFKVTHVDVNGNAQVIYPASAKDNNFIRAGETRQIPDNTRFRMTRPYGEEIILASAYTQAFTVERSGGAAPLSNNLAVRGLVVENAGTGTSMNPAATAKFSYTIDP